MIASSASSDIILKHAFWTDKVFRGLYWSYLVIHLVSDYCAAKVLKNIGIK